MIVNLGQRFGCLPSQLMQEDASELLHALMIVKWAGDDEEVANG
jgi:hypothetical protein